MHSDCSMSYYQNWLQERKIVSKTVLTSGLLAERKSLRPCLWMRFAISTTLRPAAPASDSTCAAAHLDRSLISHSLSD